VVPGDMLSDNPRLADEGTYVEDGKVFSSFFGVASLKNHIKVVPLSGKYIPKTGDMVIGIIKDITLFNWIVDIRSPYEGLLHVSEYPKYIDNADMSKHLKVGDAIIAQVKDVDASMKVELTMNEKSKQIEHGRIVEVTPSKVARLIGRGGSMIALLKNETNCNIFIGQNGRIWVTGKDKDVELAVKAIFKVERETHISGLTDRITRFLKEEKGEKGEKIEEKEKKKIEEEQRPGGILDELLGE